MSETIAVDQKADERKALNEKKIQRVVEWLTGEKNDEELIRHKGLVIFTKGLNSGADFAPKLCVLRDTDVVGWFTKAKDEELKTACEWDEAMRKHYPKSRHLTADTDEPVNGES